MNNLTQFKHSAEQAYLGNRQERLLALYERADWNERRAIIGHVDSFLFACGGDEKRFWLKLRRKLEILNEKAVLFPLGSIYLTIGAREALRKSNQEPFEFLLRHQRGDWGDLGRVDIEENIRSLKVGYRLLSAYETAKGKKIWIITEADRSLTTVLLPSEY